MPETPIMDMVDNVESLYNEKMALFDRWMAKGDVWSKSLALMQARSLAAHFAEAIESSPDWSEGRYTKKEIREAAEEMLEQFEEHREYRLKEVTQRERTPQPSEPMTQQDIEHAEKYDALSRKIGIDSIRQLIPASPERIRRALETGDSHLNTIPLRQWDIAASWIRVPGLSLAEKVCVLKHVAKWHYA